MEGKAVCFFAPQDIYKTKQLTGDVNILNYCVKNSLNEAGEYKHFLFAFSDVLS